MNKVTSFIKKETVLFIAALFAFVSIFLAPPWVHHHASIDWSVLAILFCLMIVTAGLRKLGIFDFISQKMLARTKSVKYFSILLVNIVFVSSMFVTNDVALIVFVPLTIEILAHTGRKKLIFVIVMETIAANLGSMLTPIGNPQNLYIYSFYQLDILSFFKQVLPVGAVSYIIIMGIMLVSKNDITIAFEEKLNMSNIKKPLLYYTALFILCIVTVLRILDYKICILIVFIATLITDKKLLKKVDYGLLLTFICFFVFVGNLKEIAVFRNALIIFLEGKIFIASILSSQVISNVPAAVMISHFTNESMNLLLGVNIGGLGTPIASFASLISFRLYSRSENAEPGKFLLIFSIYNILILIFLTAIFFNVYVRN